MSKKDYIAVAKIIKNAVEQTRNTGSLSAVDAVYQVAYDLASMFKSDNERFKRNTFLDACDVPTNFSGSHVNRA